MTKLRVISTEKWQSNCHNYYMHQKILELGQMQQLSSNLTYQYMRISSADNKKYLQIPGAPSISGAPSILGTPDFVHPRQLSCDATAQYSTVQQIIKKNT